MGKIQSKNTARPLSQRYESKKAAGGNVGAASRRRLPKALEQTVNKIVLSRMLSQKFRNASEREIGAR